MLKRSVPPRALFALALLVSLTAVSAAAQSEGSFNAERFRPSLDRSGFFDLEGSGVPAHLDYDVGLFLGYENNPIQLRGATQALVGPKFGANLVGAIGLLDFIQVGIDVPLVLFQSSTLTDPTLLGLAKPLPAFALGDLRLAPKFKLLSQKTMVVDLAVMPAFTLPTNSPAGSFAGDALPTFVPEVLVGKSLLGTGESEGPLRVEGNIGLRLRSPAQLLNYVAGQELTYRFGANYRLEQLIKVPLRVGVNASGGMGLNALERGNSYPLEFLAGATYDVIDNLEVGAAFGVGAIGGVGTPDFRAMAMARWAPRAGGKDSDGDGFANSDDSCIDAPEDKDGFEDSDGCPDPDNDQDGFNDVDDACADTAGTEGGCPPSAPIAAAAAGPKDTDSDGLADSDDACPAAAGTASMQGCPDTDKDGFADNVDKCVSVAGLIVGCPDGDKDGIADKDDLCPTVAELVNKVQDEDGCPEVDSDGDGVVDPIDNCPKEKGSADNAGCAKKQKVTIQPGKTIDITESVLFTTGKAEINVLSFGLLDNIASVLNSHPEIKQVRVEGHTDAEGDAAANQALSAARAASVVKYLVKKGVKAERLEAMGFGSSKPLADNGTPEGRAQNRRVAFTIVGVPVAPN